MAVVHGTPNDLEKPEDDVNELLQYPNYCTCCDLEIPVGIVLCDDCERDSEAFEPSDHDFDCLPESRQRWRDLLVRRLSCPEITQAVPPHVSSAYDTVYADEMRVAVATVSSGDMVPQLKKFKQELGQAIDADQITRAWRPQKRESMFFRFALISMLLMTLVAPTEAHEEDPVEKFIGNIQSLGWALFPFMIMWSVWSLTSSFTGAVTKLLSLVDVLGHEMVKYTKISCIIQGVATGLNVLLGVATLYTNWRGTWTTSCKLANEALQRGSPRKLNKIGVAISMLLACLMFIVAPLWGCSKAFKKFEPMMRMLEKLPYVTWFVEWFGNYLNGDATLEDIPDEIRDLKNAEPKRTSFPWRTTEDPVPDEKPNVSLKHDVEGCTDKGKCALGKCLCKCHVEEEYEIFKEFDLKARCDNKDIQAERAGLGSEEREPYQRLVDVAHQIMRESTPDRVKRWRRYYNQAKRADPERAATIIEKFIFRYPWMSFLKDADIDEDVAQSSEVRDYDDVMTDMLLLTHYMCVKHDEDCPTEPVMDHPLKNEAKDVDEHLAECASRIRDMYGGLPFLRFYDPWFGTTTEINPPCYWPKTMKEKCVDSFWRTLGFGESTAKTVAAHVKKHQRKYALGASAAVALLAGFAYLFRSEDPDEPIWEDEAKGKTKSRRSAYVPGASRRPERGERVRKPWMAASSGSEDEVSALDGDEFLTRFDEVFYHGTDTGSEYGYSREGLKQKDKLLEVLLTASEMANIRALRKLKPTPPRRDAYKCNEGYARGDCECYDVHDGTPRITKFFKPVTKNSLRAGPAHCVTPASMQAVQNQLPPKERVADVVAEQKKAYQNPNAKTMESEALLGKKKINFTEHASRVFQFCLDGKMVSSATVVGDKVVFPLHALQGNEDASPSIANFSATANLKKQYVEIAPDLGMVCHHGAVSVNKHFTMRAPDNEMVFVLGFNDKNQQEPTAGIGHCAKDGVYDAQTLPGDCGGAVIAAKDGALVGFHIAGSDFMNKFIPMTENIAKALKTPAQAINSSLFHQRLQLPPISLRAERSSGGAILRNSLLQ